MTMGPVMQCLRHWADLEKREEQAFGFKQVLASNGDPHPALERRTLLDMELDDEESDDSDLDRAARRKRLQATSIPNKALAPRDKGKARQVDYEEVNSEDEEEELTARPRPRPIPPGHSVNKCSISRGTQGPKILLLAHQLIEPTNGLTLQWKSSMAVVI